MSDHLFRKESHRSKFRILIAIIAVVGLVSGIYWAWHEFSKKEALRGDASLASAPSIHALPGSGNPSQAYESAQSKENALKAQEARQTATSDVPTITRGGFVVSTSDFEKPDDQSSLSGKVQGPSCPLNKVVYMYKPNPANCDIDNLKRARSAGVNAEELICQSCPCSNLKLAGYTAGDLKGTGYSAASLKSCGFALDQLRAAGFSADDLKSAGFSAADLKQAGFSATELAAAGFNTDELAAAGFSPADIKAAQAVLATQTNKVACSADALSKARLNDESIKDIQARGCSLDALKAAEFSAEQLKEAGFSADQLKAAGFSADELKAAGFSAKELKAAGFSADQLKEAGFNAGELKAAGYSPEDLKQAGFSDRELKAAGFSAAEIAAANQKVGHCDIASIKKARDQGTSAAEIKAKGCSLSALKAAGFTAAELRNAGFSAAELHNAGFSAAELKDAGFSAAELKQAGFDAKALKDAGFSAEALKAAGFSAQDLHAAGFSAAELKNAGFSAAELKRAGFDAKALKDAGFSAATLKALGFTAGDLKDAGFSASALKNAGFSAAELRNAGYSADALKTAGFSPSELRQAGFTRGDLVRAGFSPQMAGYPSEQVAASTAGSNPPPLSGTQGGGSYGGSGTASEIPTIGQNSAVAGIQAIQKAQQASLTAQERSELMQQMQGQMSLQAQKLMAAWSNNSQQTYQVGVHTPAPGEGAGQGGAANGPTGPIFKAGTIMFAVLDTSINSDEQSPIMATIVDGAFKGGKLLGNFQRVDKKLLVEFNLLSLPSFDKSIPLNAVAIDQNTARTALSGDVNNHYLLRYGSLFASAFLAGIGDAIIQGNSTTQCIGALCNTTTGKFNTNETLLYGAGTVGKQYANVMGDNFHVPPTVKIPGGVGIGILIMQDLTLPGPLPVKENFIKIPE